MSNIVEMHTMTSCREETMNRSGNKNPFFVLSVYLHHGKSGYSWGEPDYSVLNQQNAEFLRDSRERKIEKDKENSRESRR